MYRLLSKAAYGLLYKTRVYGNPYSGRCIYISNHSSHLDTVSILTTSGKDWDEVRPVAAKDYFSGDVPWYQLIPSKMFNLLLLDREGGGKKFIGDILRIRKESSSYIIYPEGTRSKNARINKFMGGAIVMSSILGIPVVPVYIGGADIALPKGSFLPRPATLRLHYGDPIFYPGSKELFSDCDMVQLSSRLRESVYSLKSNDLKWGLK